VSRLPEKADDVSMAMSARSAVQVDCRMRQLRCEMTTRRDVQRCSVDSPFRNFLRAWSIEARWFAHGVMEGYQEDCPERYSNAPAIYATPLHLDDCCRPAPARHRVLQGAGAQGRAYRGNLQGRALARKPAGHVSKSIRVFDLRWLAWPTRSD